MTTDDQKRPTLAEFIEAHSVTAEAQRITREAFLVAVPGADFDEKQADRTYWMITLHREGGRSFAVPYSAGSSAWWTVRGDFIHRREGDSFGAKCRGCYEAWPCTSILQRSWLPTAPESIKPTPPTVGDVLDSLASDSSGYDSARDLADWCADYGYDSDSRRAERTYNLIAEQAKQLKQLLGPEAYEALLWNTERE